VNQIYEIQRFKILTAKSFYRPVDASLMIQFIVFTQIHVVPDPPNTFPSIIYKLMDFRQIDDLAGQTENFIGIKKYLNHLIELFSYTQIHFTIFTYLFFLCTFKLFHTCRCSRSSYRCPAFAPSFCKECNHHQRYNSQR
jgi:hypothetical protein